VPDQNPELGFLMRCQELLERARAVGTVINERFRQVTGLSAPGPAAGSSPGPTPAPGAASGLAKMLLRRLFEGRPPSGRPS
jgi:hypothetical protein